MKVLFFLPVPVFMCYSLAYRLSNYKDDAVMLAVDQRMFAARNYIKYLERLKIKKVIDDVFYCDLFIDRGHLPKQSDEIGEYVTRCFDREFPEAGCNITDYEEIVVFNDVWCADINLYLNYKEIYYKWIEPGYNSLMIGAARDYPKLLKNEINRLNAESPLAKYACPVLFEESKNSAEIMRTRVKDFELWSLNGSVMRCSDERLNDIIDCYRTGFKIERDFSLFIADSYGASKSFSNNAFINEYGQRIIGYREYEVDEIFSIIYLLLLDIYMPAGKVYIKFHPNDPMLNDRKKELYPPDVEIFNEAPFEFISEYLCRKNIRIENLLVIGSTCGNNLNDMCCNHNTILGLDFFKTMHCYASLYVLSFLLDFLDIKRVATSKYIASQLQIMSKKKFEYVHINGYEHLRELAGSFETFIIIDALCESFDEEEIRSAGDDKYLCFINVNFSKTFIPGDLFQEFVPIELMKTSIDINSPLQYNEYLWIYTQSTGHRKKLRKFRFNKKMSFSKINLYIKAHTIQEEIELAERYIMKSALSRNESIYKCYSALKKEFLEFAVEKSSTRSLTEFIHHINDISDYLDLLSIVKGKYMIICAVRDTPGDFISPMLLSKIHSLGLKKFTKELWRMYVGIIWNDKTLFDMCGEEREKPIDIHCSNSFYATDIHIISKAWRKGDVANIYINGKDYSTNDRGINIVVYDPEEKIVLDSICFDGHRKVYRFVRRQI